VKIAKVHAREILDSPAIALVRLGRDREPAEAGRVDEIHQLDEPALGGHRQPAGVRLASHGRPPLLWGEEPAKPRQSRFKTTCYSLEAGLVNSILDGAGGGA
jgi:hypothetical protein